MTRASIAAIGPIAFLIVGDTSLATNIPPQVKQVVAFIFIERPDGKLVANGTAFFVGVPDEQNPERSYVYLVTAKHVLQKTEGGPFFPAVFVRLDKKDGSAETVKLPIVASGDKRTVFFHDDTTVDLAVFPALPDEKIFDFKFLPASMVLEGDALQAHNIAEGTEVFFTGLFTPHVGEQRNYPIVRFGRVALMTPERINWNGVKTELYLVESGSYGGNSGSPVFFYLGADRLPGSITVGSPELYLAGVMKGAFQEGRPIQVVPTSETPVSVANIGIAAVVPAPKLREILFGAELKRTRARPSK